MNIDNKFEILVAVVFSIITQLGGLGTKSQDIVIYFCLGEGGTLQQFHLRDLQIKSENVLLNDETGRIHNHKGKHIMEISK